MIWYCNVTWPTCVRLVAPELRTMFIAFPDDPVCEIGYLFSLINWLLFPHMDSTITGSVNAVS
jgi:hypothetical protein